METDRISKRDQGVGDQKKNIFTKILVAKILWNSIHKNSLCAKVISKKYIFGHIMEEWIRNPSKFRTAGSISWNAMLDVYHLVGDWFCWQVGNGHNVRIGEDPWIGGGGGLKLSIGILEELHVKGVYSMWDAMLNDMDGFGCSVWKYVEMLELSKIHKEEWISLCSLLYANFVKLQEYVEDAIC
jgi:hypothetical protein